MKRMSLYLVALAWIVPAHGVDDSQHKIGAGIALASDYLFRGISQTDNNPAIQGSLEYGYEPWGVYLGTWASNVNSMTSDGRSRSGGSVACAALAATGIAWDLGVVYYHYPGDDLEPEKDYVEPKLGLSHELAGLPLTPRVSASVHCSPDFYLETGDAVYVEGTVGMSLPTGSVSPFTWASRPWTRWTSRISTSTVILRELSRLAGRDLEGGVGVRTRRQLLGRRERGGVLRTRVAELPGHGGEDDIPEILTTLPRSGAGLTPD